MVDTDLKGGEDVQMTSTTAIGMETTYVDQSTLNTTVSKTMLDANNVSTEMGQKQPVVNGSFFENN